MRERGAIHVRMENYIRDENYEIGCEAGTAMNACGEKNLPIIPYKKVIRGQVFSVKQETPCASVG